VGGPQKPCDLRTLISSQHKFVSTSSLAQVIQNEIDPKLGVDFDSRRCSEGRVQEDASAGQAHHEDAEQNVANPTLESVRSTNEVKEKSSTKVSLKLRPDHALAFINDCS
jgi:hypothetical protein